MSTTRRVLAIHGSVVGTGWFVVALPSLLLIQGGGGAQDWFGDLAPAVQGMLGAVIVVCAVPILWPIYLAIGWYETNRASHFNPRDGTTAVQRLITAQALLTAAAGIGVAILGLAFRGVNGGEYLTLAWIPLGAIAFGHLWTAKRLATTGQP